MPCMEAALSMAVNLQRNSVPREEAARQMREAGVSMGTLALCLRETYNKDKG